MSVRLKPDPTGRLTLVRLIRPGRAAAEHLERNRNAHTVVAERRWMDAVATVVCGIDQIGRGGIAHHLVEVEHGVERSLRADPLVDLVADRGLLVVPPAVGTGRRDVVPRDDRRADDPQPLRLDALRDVSLSGDHLLSGCAAADVVRADE